MLFVGIMMMKMGLGLNLVPFLMFIYGISCRRLYIRIKFGLIGLKQGGELQCPGFIY